MDDLRPPGTSGGPDDGAPSPVAPRLKHRRLRNPFRGKDGRKVGERLQVVGPAVQLAPQPAGPPPPRRRSAAWRVFFGLLKTVLFVGTLGAVAAGGLIAWAVYDVPLDKYNAAAATPSLAIEAADGTSLGRRGPFKVADVALSDYPPRLVAAVLSIEDR